MQRRSFIGGLIAGLAAMFGVKITKPPQRFALIENDIGMVYCWDLHRHAIPNDAKFVAWCEDQNPDHYWSVDWLCWPYPPQMLG